MNTASCHQQLDCPRRGCCAPAQAEEEDSNAIIWIVARDERSVHLFVHRPGHPIEPLSIGCGCSSHAGRPENLAKYLDAALACGQYGGLVLMAKRDMQQYLKRLLSDAVQRRIIAEIDRDVTELSPPALLQAVRECSLL